MVRCAAAWVIDNIADLIIEVENGEANITLDENMASGFEEVTAEDIESDVAGLHFLGKEENEALLVEGSEGNIFDLCKEMADFWMSKGECKTDELDDYFTLVK